MRDEQPRRTAAVVPPPIPDTDNAGSWSCLRWGRGWWISAGTVEVGAREAVPPAKRRQVVAVPSLKTAAAAEAIQRLFKLCRAVFTALAHAMLGTIAHPAGNGNGLRKIDVVYWLNQLNFN